MYYDLKDPINLIGDKVMIRSNEDEPLYVATVVGWHVIKSSRTPIVESESEYGTQYVALGVVLPYDEKLRTFLETMPPKEQYALCAKTSIVTQIIHRRVVG